MMFTRHLGLLKSVGAFVMDNNLGPAIVLEKLYDSCISFSSGYSVYELSDIIVLGSLISSVRIGGMSFFYILSMNSKIFNSI